MNKGDRKVVLFGVPPSGGRISRLKPVLQTRRLGSLIAWLYVSFRPRFGPGIATAMIVGVVAWLFGVVNVIHMASDNFGFPPSLMVAVGAAVLRMFLCASIVGAWAYRE